MNEWMNEWMKSRGWEDNRCALLYKIYNITRYNGERSLLKSERKEKGR